MLNTLVLEIRDRGTLIPCIATQVRTKVKLHKSAIELETHTNAGGEAEELGTQEAYLLKRAGSEDKAIFVTTPWPPMTKTAPGSGMKEQGQ